MAYTYDRVLKDTKIDDAEMRVRDALADKGFGVLTEIDVKATMKKKLDADMPPYTGPNATYQESGQASPKVFRPTAVSHRFVADVRKAHLPT